VGSFAGNSGGRDAAFFFDDILPEQVRKPQWHGHPKKEDDP
jgi:hypothetical protein